ncbi:MAG: hypothetical protein HYY13_03670 [Nitrospirae bacterium]|nr:hypothetical protein [Nitrospirota bacterium]
MKDTAITIRIEEDTWKGFKRLSRRRGKTASEVLRALMEREVQETEGDTGRQALLAMGCDPSEGRGPGDLSLRADDYLYGRRAKGARPKSRP